MTSMISRRAVLRAGGMLATAAWVGGPAFGATAKTGLVTPSDEAWPDSNLWDALARQLRGTLAKVVSPLRAAAADPNGPATRKLFEELRNPYFIGDTPGLTQTLGWTDAWTSRPSEYVVRAADAHDVAAAVRFARARNVKLVVRGGAHSYLGNSNAADSLMVWTKAMDAVQVHTAFTCSGADAHSTPVQAVSVGAGATWGRVYDEVTTRSGRYVQGGGCMTVGVAGLVQGGGFGSFSKRYGTAAGSLIEAEIVTADGEVRIANRFVNPDLFWALKGGGGGTFGIVTRMTLRTHDLPQNFGIAAMRIQAKSDVAYRSLVERIVDLYRTRLMNEHWGEQIIFAPHRRLAVQMVFQGLEQKEAEALWAPFLETVRGDPDLTLTGLQIAAFPARHFWDPAFLTSLPGIVKRDDRPGATTGNLYWSANVDEAGQVLHGYHSAWLPESLLANRARPRLVDALVAHAGMWTTALHVNKGLAGAPADAIASARDTAMNPAVLKAFALIITAGEEGPAYPGIAGHEPDVSGGREEARIMEEAFGHISRLMPTPASYVSESDFFEPQWRHAHWGRNYDRLLAIKKRYDPGKVFMVHHGVGASS